MVQPRKKIERKKTVSEAMGSSSPSESNSGLGRQSEEEKASDGDSISI